MDFVQWQCRHGLEKWWRRYDTKPLENRDPFKIWCQPWCICDRLNVESSRLKMKQRTTYKRNLPIFHINSRNIDGWWFLSKMSLSEEIFHFYLDVVLLTFVRDKIQRIRLCTYLPDGFQFITWLLLTSERCLLLNYSEITRNLR